MANLMPRRDREASVATVDVPLTPEALRRHFLGREAYRRTRFIIARRGEEAAVLRIDKASPARRCEAEEPLFSPIVAVEILAGPDECAIIWAPEVDTANPTHMARAALQRAPRARCTVVQGRYEHVSFILEPAALQLRVVDVVPPEPPKLVDQIERVLDVAEELPPIELQPELVDLRELARAHRLGTGAPASDRYLFPCRVSGVSLEGALVDYLDQRPQLDSGGGKRARWTLVGCARSREMYRWFYGEEPNYLESCPRRLLDGGGVPKPETGLPALTKCCLLESQVRQEGRVVTVPWGATLDEVRRGLERLLRTVEPAWSAA